MSRSFDVSARSESPPACLWSLLLDARTWPVWSLVDALVPERSQNLSAAGRDEVGAVRAFRTGRVVTGERITELRPERVFRYEDAFNPVLHDYSASVELEPTASGGTLLRWRGTYTTKPVLGVFLEWYLRRFMQKMVDGLAVAATPT